MENNEVKNENATEEKKTESDKAEKEFNGTKWRCITIALTAILIFAATLFFVVTYFKDDSGRSLIEYIEQGLVVVAALISGCVSIISMINGKENDIEQQKREKQLINEQKEFEEKWNQKKIDADLKAKARIEWIQRVREATSIFITSCYSMAKMIDFGNKDEQTKAYINAKENATLLSLYFGPDDSGKNQEVVTRIESILKNYETLPLDGERISNKIKTKKEHLEERKKYWLEKAPKTTNGNPDKRTTEYTLFEDYERQLNTFNSECNDIIDSSVEQLDAFNVIIRTYLKEEWNRAKNNEDDD